MLRRRRDSDRIVLLLITVILIVLILAIFRSRGADAAQEECEESETEQALPVIQEIVLQLGTGSYAVEESEPASQEEVPPLVEVARNEVGNIGGEKYWSWYGFTQRVAWCACFVSWCANECGYIEQGILPKFSVCDCTWVKEAGMWKERTGEPLPGDLIFFDWMVNGSMDGLEDHVGIVEYVDENWVYTIEGNSRDMCVRQKYARTDPQIMGYAVLNI